MPNRQARVSRLVLLSVWIAVATVAWSAAPRAAKAASLVEVTNFGANPSGLRMHLYVPDSVAPQPAVLVAIHFCTGSGPVFFSGTEFASLADRFGFIVIYPSATRSGSCFDVSSPQALRRNGGSDPVGIMSMVQHVLMNYDADASRVFVTGASSGAMMTNVLLGDYPDVFKAGAAFMGVPFGCFATTDGSMWNATCANGNSIRTAQQWGDLVRAAFPGYSGPRPRMQLWHGTEDSTLRFPNFGEEVKQWTNVLGVSGTPALVDRPQPNWTRSRYGGTGVDAPVEAISLQGVGHNLPMGGMALMAIQFFGLDRTPGGNDTQPPTAPGNLTAGTVTSSSAALSWTASTDDVGVTGYLVFRQQGASAPIQVGVSAGTTFTASGLAASTSYGFFVRAQDASGKVSASSNTVSVTTQGGGGGGSGGTPSVAITNDWGGGYCATLTVANQTGSAITWRVTFPVEGVVYDMWNATFSQAGAQVTASGVSWNAVLQPGQSTSSVGFCARR